jgi:hypothetical protein
LIRVDFIFIDGNHRFDDVIVEFTLAVAICVTCLKRIRWDLLPHQKSKRMALGDLKTSPPSRTVS